MADARYKVDVFGGCLGEWMPDGTQVVADPTEEIRPLDLVSIVFADGDGPWARWMRSTSESEGFVAACKIFLGRVEMRDGPAYLVGQIVPPVVSVIPEREIEAMHRVVGRVGGAATMTEHDRAAFALVAPFMRPGNVQPVNPEWRADIASAAIAFVEAMAGEMEAAA